MKYLITGITGTLGQAVLKILLESPDSSIVGISRCEQKQRNIPKSSRLKIMLGDVRDRDSMLRAAEGVDLIFHFAALKCVDTGEENPLEFIKTNITGTENVLAAQKYHKIPRLVLSSTDKACYPINSYGATKALAEDLVLQEPNNVVCRYGNVVGSRGSVIPAFIKAFQNDGIVSITDPNMTRFWIPIEDAARFVVDSAHGDPGLKIPDMRAALITDMAQSVARLLGHIHFKYKITGMRPGEKIHECLRMETDGEPLYSNTAVPFNPAELDNILRPVVEACR